MTLNSHPNIYSGPEMLWLGGNYQGFAGVRKLYFQLFAEQYFPVADFSECSEARISELLRRLVGDLVSPEMQRLGKIRWVEKTPDNIAQLRFLTRLFPDARFVHIVRDGRDVNDTP